MTKDGWVSMTISPGWAGTIGVVGNGVVGSATARVFMEHAEVRIYDIRDDKASHTLDDVLKCDLTFICLPTPQKPDSLECDISAIDDFCNMLGGSVPNGCYVIRSTVPIGTTLQLSKKYGLPNLCHSPEFLTARCSFTDAHCPSRNIVGVPEPRKGGQLAYKLFTGDNRAAQLLHTLYHQRFVGVPSYLMSSNESEAVKLVINSFFATKVAFFNECRAILDQKGVNWEKVMQGVLSDGRIAHAHTKVPGHDGYGFSGTCLPKDLANLTHAGMEAFVGEYFEQAPQRVYPHVMEAVLKRNKLDRAHKAEVANEQA